MKVDSANTKSAEPTKSEPRFVVLAYAIVAIYALVGTLFGVRSGLCCADDGSFAVVSKNLASGLGYALTLNYFPLPYSIQTFSPEIGLGPGSIVFVAAFVKVLGYKTWVPPLASVLLNSIYLVALTAGLLRIIGSRRTPIVLALFLAAAISINYANAAYWFTQFGEVPAVLATLGGYVWWCNPNRSMLHSLISGLLLSLGFLTKEINAMYILPIASLAVWEAAKLRKFSDLAMLCVGGLLPILAFEFYKLASLGSISAYVQNWKEHLQFISYRATNPEEDSALSVILDRAELFRHQFSVTLWFVLAITAVNAFLTRGSVSLRRLSLLLAYAICLHFIYWLFKSLGWTRYIYEALVLFSFATAIVIGSRSNKALIVFSALVIAVVVIRHKNEINDPNEQLRGQLQQTWMTPTGEADRRVLTYLLAHSSGQRVYVQWWTQIANIEYLSPRPLLFQQWKFHPDSGESHYLIVTNSRLMDTNEAPFYKALTACGTPKLEASPYSVYDCPRR